MDSRRVVVGERFEVVQADERGCRLLHRRQVERLLDPPDVRFSERGPASRDVVQVASRSGVVPGVELVRRLLDGDDVDVGRQLVVDSAAQRLSVEVRVDVEVRDLRQRVDAGVGASRPVQLELRAAGRRADRPIDLALNRARVLLNLPAAVASARVLDEEPESRHASVRCVQPAHDPGHERARRDAQHLNASLVEGARDHNRAPRHHAIVAGARDVCRAHHR